MLTLFFSQLRLSTGSKNLDNFYFLILSIEDVWNMWYYVTKLVYVCVSPQEMNQVSLYSLYNKLSNERLILYCQTLYLRIY